MPTVSVLLVNYNTRDRTAECLRSLQEQRIPGLDVVVVDNGSADGSAAALAAAFPEVTVVPSPENLGFGRAVNLAAERATGEFLLLLNPDTTVRPGALEALRDHAVLHPGNGLYGGRTLRPDGTLDPSSCWGAPTLWSMVSYALGLSTVFRRSTFFDPESLGHWQRDTVREVPIVTGCLLLVSRADFDRLQGMDPVYFLYGEDADFSTRAWALGMRPVIVPTAEIIHDNGGASADKGLKMCMVWAGRATYLWRNWTTWRARFGVAALQLGALLRSVGERATRRRSRTWTTVWSRREDWRSGYPIAEETLFGRTTPAEAA
ncbi:glycosyltransferase family 2 protein [Nakamurella alba]|uniref:glycosyltransferase family 2 protein n=1 Tax=Nakamurella alba TaxID=2665158 RepID=UPI0012B964DC|nr:glycosyltransferase family 2 protein [Nakamurella alba]